MVLRENEKYIVFSGDELRVEYEMVNEWYNYHVNEATRNRYDNGETREVLVPVSQLGMYIDELIATGISDREIEEIISDTLGSPITNWRGERNIVKEGGVWKAWQPDFKENKRKRIGDKNSYGLKDGLARLLENSLSKFEGLDDIEEGDINALFFRDDEVLDDPNFFVATLETEPMFPDNFQNIYVRIDKEGFAEDLRELYYPIFQVRTKNFRVLSELEYQQEFANTPQPQPNTPQPQPNTPQPQPNTPQPQPNTPQPQPNTPQPQPNTPQPQPNTPQPQPNTPALKHQIIGEIRTLLDGEKIDLENDNWENDINNASNEDVINEIREKVMADISVKRKKIKRITKLSELVEKAEKIEDYSELKEILGKINKFNNLDIDDILKEKINTLWEKLSKQNPEDYANNNLLMLEQELEDKRVEENELDSEIQNKIKQLQTGKITDPTTISTIKKEVSNNINLKSAEKQLGKYIEEYQKAPDDNTKKNVKKKILKFISDKNSFCQKSYQSRKDSVDRILGITSSQQPAEQNFPIVPVLIGVALVVFLISLLLLIQKRRRKTN